MKQSSKDKIAGKARELKGTVKEKTGRALGNRKMEDEGTLERAGGTVRRKVGQVKQVFEK